MPDVDQKTGLGHRIHACTSGCAAQHFVHVRSASPVHRCSHHTMPMTLGVHSAVCSLHPLKNMLHRGVVHSTPAPPCPPRGAATAAMYRQRVPYGCTAT